MDAQFTDLAVLLIDDDTQQAVATREVLTDLGCKPVAWATNREQAAQMAVSTLPDLFVIDARLLGPVDGITLLKRLRRRHGAPVIFLVEQADTNAVRQAMKVQAATSLVRPYDRTALAVAIAQALKLTTRVRTKADT
jgi:DNA-binding NtrC family response regulator